MGTRFNTFEVVVGDLENRGWKTPNQATGCGAGSSAHRYAFDAYENKYCYLLPQWAGDHRNLFHNFDPLELPHHPNLGLKWSGNVWLVRLETDSWFEPTGVVYYEFYKDNYPEIVAEELRENHD